MKRTALVVSLILLGSAGCGLEWSATAEAAPAGLGTAESEAGWTQFLDPPEHAFTMQVPRGWKVVGGLYRFGPLDPRVMVDMISPDGKTNLRVGDANVPPFATLSQTMLSLGWREGRPYSPNGVAQEVVANYRPGWVFADLYGQARFSRLCSNLKLKQMDQAPPIHRDTGAQTTAGEVVYTCDGPGGPMAAYVFAETQLTRMQSVGTWYITSLFSFVAPQDHAVQAMKTILHSVSNSEVSQEWEAMQIRLSGQAAGRAMDIFKATMAQEHARYQQQGEKFQTQTEGFSRALRGVDLTTDTVDGKQREVWAGTGGTHWINPTGTVVTQPLSPGSSFRPLHTEP
jgi:hypothetical protein